MYNIPLAIVLTIAMFSAGFFMFGYIRGRRQHFNINLSNLFKTKNNTKLHPITIEVFDMFKSHNGLRHFKQSYFCITIPLLGLSIWSENDIYDRQFYESECDTELTYKKYGKTIPEINYELSIADKTILDRICKKVVEYDRELMIEASECLAELEDNI